MTYWHPSIDEAAAFIFERWHQDIDLLRGYPQENYDDERYTTVGVYPKYKDIPEYSKKAWCNVVRNVLKLQPHE